jgi:hypothetical protein
MTSTDQIIETIYRYYPKNSDGVSDDEYATRPEVLLRRAKFDRAVNDASAWLAFSAELKERLSLGDARITVTDCYAFGRGPSFSLSFLIRNVPLMEDGIEVTVIVSIIADFWSYQFLDKTSSPDPRYDMLYEEEREKIGLVAALIKKYFSNYQLLERDVHQIVLPDIMTPYTTEPTIFQAMFVH